VLRNALILADVSNEVLNLVTGLLLIVSVIAHVAAIAAVYIAPAFATDELPVPLRATAFIVVRPALPDPPPAPRRETPAPSPHAAPLQPPDGVQPERPVVTTDQPPFDDPGALIGGVPLASIGTPGSDTIAAPPLPPRPRDPVPVGGLFQPPKKVSHVAPIYPRFALEAHKEGLVILQAVIDENGAVREVKVLRSEPLLDQAAIDAVRQWRFTPTLLNGQPIPVMMTVTVGFSLNK